MEFLQKWNNLLLRFRNILNELLFQKFYAECITQNWLLSIVRLGILTQHTSYQAHVKRKSPTEVAAEKNSNFKTYNFLQYSVYNSIFWHDNEAIWSKFVPTTCTNCNWNKTRYAKYLQSSADTSCGNHQKLYELFQRRLTQTFVWQKWEAIALRVFSPLSRNVMEKLWLWSLPFNMV